MSQFRPAGSATRSHTCYSLQTYTFIPSGHTSLHLKYSRNNQLSQQWILTTTVTALLLREDVIRDAKQAKSSKWKTYCKLWGRKEGKETANEKKGLWFQSRTWTQHPGLKKKKSCSDCLPQFGLPTDPNIWIQLKAFVKGGSHSHTACLTS